MKQICVLAMLSLTILLVGGCQSSRPISDSSFDPGDGLNVLPGDIPLDGDSPFFSGGQEHRDELAPVYFAYDSTQIAETERAKVDAMADYLKQNASSGLIVEGHSDERGSIEYNLSLGERRALAVRSYLVGLGISSERIQTRSYGEEQPAISDHDETAWSKNRRGEFVLYY